MTPQTRFHFEFRRKFNPYNPYSKNQARASLRQVAIDRLFEIIHPQQWYGIHLQVNTRPIDADQSEVEMIGDLLKLPDPDNPKPPTPADFATMELWGEIGRRMIARVWHPKPKKMQATKHP